MSGSSEREPPTQLNDGRAWSVGTEDEVAWINLGVTEGRSIAAAVPPIFEAYATVTFPGRPPLDDG